MMFEIDDVALLQQPLFMEIAADWVADHPYGEAFSSAFGTLERHMPSGVYRRYRKDWQDCFVGWMREYEYSDRKEIPDIHTCLEIRRLSVGLTPHITAAEYVNQLDLTELVLGDREMLIAKHTAVEHAMLVNELLSFRKEYYDYEYINLVASLIHVHDFSLQEAFDFISALIEDADRKLAVLIQILRLRYPFVPSSYFDTLNSICAGNLRWSFETSRYNGSTYGWNGLRSGWLSLYPHQTIIDVAPHLGSVSQ
ncbi:terpene synthase family protein [Nocardia terpenica]|nr:terpene synthase family protein [Nocardia terpenica]